MDYNKHRHPARSPQTQTGDGVRRPNADERRRTGPPCMSCCFAAFGSPPTDIYCHLSVGYDRNNPKSIPLESPRPSSKTILHALGSENLT